MSSYHIVMLLSNAFRPDPRVAREALGLVKNGYRVTILCWDRENKYAAREETDGFRVERVQDVRTVYGAGARQLLHTPRFWRSAAERAQELSPDVVHCHDLDTLPAGWWLKKHTCAHLVYDAHEDYPAMMSLYLPAPMLRALSWLERRLLRQVDYTITASTVFADKLRSLGVRPVITIGNYHQLAPFDAVPEETLVAARDRLGLAQDDLVVAYIGGFSRNRLLIPLIEAAAELPNVQVLLWGDGHQRQAVEAGVNQLPNARYLGWLPADQVPLHMKLSDIVFYCLRPDYPGAIYNAPNTLGQAMAAHRPIVANDVGDLGRIVQKTGCGILVPDVTAGSIKQAIQYLHDPAVRAKMGAAGRVAAEEKYNWAAAEQALNKAYQQILRR